MADLVTGAAGFIGYHLAERLLAEGRDVVGVDAMTDYYDVMLKERRLALLGGHPRFRFRRLNLEDADGVQAAFADARPERVFHLAAQAGVQYSVRNPAAYVGANIVGAFNVLEACRRHPVAHLMFASTSSAYGAGGEEPFAENDPARYPITLYAASKGSGELMSHAYAHLFGTPTTAFRFFTVYGPWGRPDMAYWKFTDAVMEGRPVELFNDGDCWRDFTYVDDLVTSIVALSALPPPAAGARAEVAAIPGDSLSPAAPWRLVNIGPGAPARITQMLEEIEKALGRTAARILKPLPPGDMARTHASPALLEALTGGKPSTPLSVGVPRFVAWRRAHFN